MYNIYYLCDLMFIINVVKLHLINVKSGQTVLKKQHVNM